MSNLSAVRLRNLRCFSDTSFIELKPITLLVGKNSAGKSTFARLFPLLRQSAEEEKRSPILWFGRFVDFGNFSTAVNRDRRGEPIEFSFKVKISPRNIFRTRRFNYWMDGAADDVRLSGETVVVSTLKLEQKKNSTACYASYIKLEIFGNICEVLLSESGKLQELKVNHRSWVLGDGSVRAIVTQGKIFPNISFVRQASRRVDGEDRKIWHGFDPFLSATREAAYNAFVNRKVSSDTLDLIISNTELGSDDSIIKSLSSNPLASPSFRRKAAEINKYGAEFYELKRHLFLRAIPFVLAELDKQISADLDGVRYIEPLRATALRYYRLQELAVEELDSKGANLAMFIDSLAEGDKVRLNAWLNEHFQVGLRAVNDGGHVALELQPANARASTNLADLGFGFSQVLPIALQLWHSAQILNQRSRSVRSNSDTILVMEQPELHLHPAYQAKIADVIVASLSEAKTLGRRSTVIAETHSSHLINRFGQLIEEGVISKDDVQVVLFEQGVREEGTVVRATSFDDEGVLIDWPYGFFEPGC